MHLSPDLLIDLVEGRRPESSEPHLSQCDKCRDQLTELRALMNAAASVDVPEPSPLFWGHFSERVRQAVEAEPAPVRARWIGISRWLDASWWRLALPLAAAAAIVAIAVGIGRGPTKPATALAPASGSAIAEAVPDLSGLPEFGAADDSSLALVGALAAQMDAEAVAESGLVTHPGGVDEVVVTMTAGERSELQQILKDELAKS
jgi:hypothetical protein